MRLSDHFFEVKIPAEACAYCKSRIVGDKCRSCGAPATIAESLMFVDQRVVDLKALADAPIVSGAMYPVTFIAAYGR